MSTPNAPTGAEDKSTGEEAMMASPSTRQRATPRSNSASISQLVSAVTAALEPVSVAAGFDLEGVEITPAGRRRVLRVVVDRDGGLDLDAVAVVSREFATALDADTVMGDAPYVLEVTSPGVDRPITTPRQWRRAIGRLVEAPLHDGGTVRGRVAAADETTVSFDIDGEQRVVALAELSDGRMQLEFERSGGVDA
jgi:ribosome maturation factor RimP